jgi:hypothetical protein
MKVILTETQLKVLLKEEFSEKVITQLIDKFISSNPHAYRDKIKDYIKIFDKIKNGPNIINKDISTYSLPELEEVIINYIKNQKPKSFKGDSNLDLLYSKDGLEIFLANSKDKCIKYGNGYNFCISSHGEDNLYHEYRFDKNGTPYFIFNRNLESSKDMDDADGKTFLVPEHLIVLFVYKVTEPRFSPSVDFEDEKDKSISGPDYHFTNNDVYYSITTANNVDELFYLNFETIERIYPSLTGLKNLFTSRDFTQKEHDVLYLQQYGNRQLQNINKKYQMKFDERISDCPNIDIKIRDYSQLMGKDRARLLEYFNAYKNKLFKTYRYKYPLVRDGELKYDTRAHRFIGPNAVDDLKKHVKEQIDIYKESVERYRDEKGSLDALVKRNPNIMKEYEIRIDLKSYPIYECKWTDDFKNYLKEIYDLYKDLIYDIWSINQSED